MSRTLTYGMVGGGPGAFIGEAHRKAIALDGSARLVAGCFSRSPEKTRALGEELGLDPERCYADYRDMARAEAQREDGIDFVVVVTPNVTHYEICKAFLEAGIHVSCDKPLATDSAQGEELKQLAQEKGLLFMVTYTYTGHVTAKYIRDLIRAGEIGVVRTVMAEYPQGWLYSEDDCGGKQGAWRCDPAQSGRVNCLGDIGTHVENAVSTMTGLKIKRLLAKMDVVVPGRKLDDNDQVLVEYEGEPPASTGPVSSPSAVTTVYACASTAPRGPSSGTRSGARRSPSSGRTASPGPSSGATRRSLPPRPSTAASPPDTPRAGWRPWATCTTALPSAWRPSRPAPLRRT